MLGKLPKILMPEAMTGTPYWAARWATPLDPADDVYGITARLAH